MVEAVTSRELLLREFAALIRHETLARRVLVLEPGEGERQRVLVAHGYTARESERIAELWAAARDDEERGRVATAQDAAVIRLRVMNAAPATLFVSPRASGERADREALG